jgi:creatinine amidohydrolase
VCASFVPLSRFACDADALAGDALVVFSQGLSPNARIALGHKGFARTMVVSARGDIGASVALRHPPPEEGAMLARVQGPPAATLLGLRVVAALGGEAPHAGIVAAVREALAARPLTLDPRRPVALVLCDDERELGHGLRWKWLEATRRSDVAVYDALGFAHGPLQCCAERGAQVVLLPRDDPREAALWTRVRDVLAETSCAVHALPSSLPGVWSFFEHDARWSAALRASLAAAGDVDLLRWPAQGRDGALYDLDAPLNGATSRDAR